MSYIGSPTTSRATNKQLWSSPDKEGYLKKTGEINKAKKKRLFVLQGPTLFYFKKKGGQPAGSISITDCFVEQSSSSNDFEFQIKSPYFDRVFRLHAETKEQRAEWVEALTNAIAKHCASVSKPVDLQHHYHVSFDPEEGYKVQKNLFLFILKIKSPTKEKNKKGLPDTWKALLEKSGLSTQEVLENQDAVLSALNTQMNFISGADPSKPSHELPETGPESIQLSTLNHILFNYISREINYSHVQVIL